MSNRLDIMMFDMPELKSLVADLGEKGFRGLQLAKWLYLNRADSFESMNNLPKLFRERLEESYVLAQPRIVQKVASSDKTTRYLLEFADGAQTETVAIPSKKRLTVCVSSQAGCALGCIFCATGSLGLKRSLLPGEILSQISVVSEDFNSTENANELRVSNVVVMGQGEPFANYDATLSALRMINSSDLFGVGARHITVSTAGLLRQLQRFSDEPEQFTLAISLHSAIQETRNLLMPGLSSQPLRKLRENLITYMKKTSRRPSLEYALIKGVNDDERSLESLLAFCDVPAPGFHVNLIALNAISAATQRSPQQDKQSCLAKRPSKLADNQIHLEKSPVATVQRFERKLAQAGVSASRRLSRGNSVGAACGQLASKANNTNNRV